MTCEVPAANSRFCAWKDSKRSLGYLRDIIAPGFKDVCETVFIVALFRMSACPKTGSINYHIALHGMTIPHPLKKKKRCSL